jgi:Fe-Mn family superoxide dismutase
MHAFSRRTLVAGSLAGAAVLASSTLTARRAFAQAPAGPFKHDPLPYPHNALEPHIDTMTMELHHGRHHASFVTNLNNAAKENDILTKTPLHELLAKLNSVPEGIRTLVRNNGGGHANHTMFWQIMGKPGAGGPQGDVAKAIESDLGGFEKMKTDFNAAGGRQFGSGWVFVTVTKDGKLAIETRPNQDSPIMDGKLVLIGNDVWEHAYYLKYQNRRAEYLTNWWNVVDWSKVGERFAAAKNGTLTI